MKARAIVKHYSRQLDCENPEVRNRKGAESGLVRHRKVISTHSLTIIIYWHCLGRHFEVPLMDNESRR